MNNNVRSRNIIMENCQTSSYEENSDPRWPSRMSSPFFKFQLPARGFVHKIRRPLGQLPYRFQNAELIQGYSTAPRGRKWFTSNSEYGNSQYLSYHLPKVYHGVEWRASNVKQGSGKYKHSVMIMCNKDK